MLELSDLGQQRKKKKKTWKQAEEAASKKEVLESRLRCVDAAAVVAAVVGEGAWAEPDELLQFQFAPDEACCVGDSPAQEEVHRALEDEEVPRSVSCEAEGS